MGHKIIATNRKAYHNYHILQKYESGIVLLGSEVKSVRESKISIKESYIRFIKDELYAIGMNISEYSNQGYSTHDPQRVKKLLLNRKELKEILYLLKYEPDTISEIGHNGRQRYLECYNAAKSWKKMLTIPC